MRRLAGFSRQRRYLTFRLAMVWSGVLLLVLAFAGEAESYRITWNGLLVHGRPGVGKTFVAKATAGEFVRTARMA